MSYDRPGLGDQLNISIVEPYTMDDVEALVQQAEIMDITNERPAIQLRLAEYALKLCFKHVDVEWQVVRAAEIVERREIVRRHALWRRAGDGGGDPAFLPAVPISDQIVIAAE